VASPASPAARAVRGIEARLAGCLEAQPAGQLFLSLAARMGVRWSGAAAAVAAGVAGLGGVTTR
jgi:hypothetical protein